MATTRPCKAWSKARLPNGQAYPVPISDGFRFLRRARPTSLYREATSKISLSITRVKRALSTKKTTIKQARYQLYASKFFVHPTEQQICRPRLLPSFTHRFCTPLDTHSEWTDILPAAAT